MTDNAVFNAVAKVAVASGATANQKALESIRGGIRARVIEIKKNIATTDEPQGESKAMSQDPVGALINKGDVIEPPFDLLTLSMLPENNTELGQCIEAMETNIDGFGHRYTPRIRIDDETMTVPDEVKGALRLERIKLENFFMYATGDDSFTKFRRKLRQDYETTGNSYFEVIRSVAGNIQGFRHIPSHHMTIGKLEDEAILVDRPILELQNDGSVKVVTMKEWRKFRLYAQARSVYMRNMSIYTGKVRWFKQLGDPRIYSCETGEEADAKLPPEKRANEIVHMAHYCARSPYGLPRYIGNLLSVFGDRAAEEINFVTFRNNNIPSMVVCVSNGQLTEGTIQRIESFVESQIQGSDNYSKFLILEAETALEGDEGGQIKMDIKPLVKEQHKDALFQNYSQNNQDKIRRAFRLPPIFVGRSDDYTRATAEASRRLADEQIFAPERDEFDEMMNRTLFPYMGIVYHKFKSNSPNTTDNAELTKILAGSEKTGGMTPRIARQILEEILSRDIGPFPKGFPADIPFSLTMAEAVKNLAQPTEPGQQFTAIKAIKALTGDSDDVEKGEDPVVDYLMNLNKRIEKKWQVELKRAREAEDELFDKSLEGEDKTE